MSDWTVRRWISDDMTMKQARQAERDGLGRVIWDDDPGPALWIPASEAGDA